MKTKTATYRAAWVLPIDRPPIQNGRVRIVDGLIESVEESNTPQDSEIDLGQSILMPGLVNAHTHLEFSDLKSPLGQPGIEFTEWIDLVVQHRHASSQQREAQAIKSATIVAGLQESAERGVALLGEIATSPICADAYSSSEIDVIAFLERLGRDDSQIDDKLDSLNVELVEFAFNNVDIGISPHAPYSVSDRLLDRLINWAVEKNIPLAMHLAESQSELELLETGTGPFTELLKKLNAWFPDSYTNGIRPQAYLDKLALAQNSLLIHGNYLSESELQFLADHRNRISVVFCPRTHSYFGHSPYPLARMLELGINVAVGTDSRASNPDLCLMSELQTISNAFPDVKPEEIVRMGTINGAKALGRSDAFGSLTPGKSACLCTVTCEPDLLNGDPYLAVLKGKPSLLR